MSCRKICPKTFNFVKFKVVACDHYFETSVILFKKKFSNIREPFGQNDS